MIERYIAYSGLTAFVLGMPFLVRALSPTDCTGPAVADLGEEITVRAPFEGPRITAWGAEGGEPMSGRGGSSVFSTRFREPGERRIIFLYDGAYVGSCTVHILKSARGSIKFDVHDPIRVDTEGASLNVRAEPGGVILGTQPHGSLGTIQKDHFVNNELTWWYIDYETGADGWSAEPYLEELSRHSDTARDRAIIAVAEDEALREKDPHKNTLGAGNLSFADTGARRTYPLFGFPLNHLTGVSIEKADLVLTLESTNLASSTLALGAYHVLIPWEEGSASTSRGATWACPADTNLSNDTEDCDAPWNGGIFELEAASITPLSHGMREARFDVTSDIENAVRDGHVAISWLIKSPKPWGAGNIKIFSREASSTLAAHLAITAKENISLLDRLRSFFTGDE